MHDTLVMLKGICKSFPGVLALDDVSFDLMAGEVHALLGENGAGKSTLMKILSGVYERDSGGFWVNGTEVTHMTPRIAQSMGITIIHQELNMCAHLTVAENMFLGRENAKHGYIYQKKLNARAREMLAKLNLDIDPQTVVGKLPVSKQQMVEIAKALSTDARIIIMDEPTSALTEREIDELFEIIQRLKSDGRGIVYISHRLDELSRVVDRLTVLRDGRFVATKRYDETSIPEIISLMVGREIKEKYPRVSSEKGKKILEVKNLCAGIVKNVSFDLFEGEMIGISGLMGAGRTELVRALFGVDPIESGEVLLFSNPVNLKSPIDAIRAGIVCAPEDRKKDGLCVGLTIQENIAMANLDTLRKRFGIVNREKEKQIAEQAVAELHIKTPSIKQDVKNLSGGNQQKVVVGKWLVRNAKVVIFDEPTRGIDVAAKVEIYNLMNKLKQSGIGVLFVSSELPEILGMSDRVIVMCNGRITGEMPAKEATQDKILHLATQYRAEPEVSGYAG